MIESHQIVQSSGKSICARCNATINEMHEWCSRRLVGKKIKWPERFLDLVEGEPEAVIVGALSPNIVIARHSNGREYPVNIERLIT